MRSQQFGALIEMLFNRVPNIDQAVISVHCHNDLGLAVTNSLTAHPMRALAKSNALSTAWGVREDAAMEEIVMALRTRHDRFALYQ